MLIAKCTRKDLQLAVRMLFGRKPKAHHRTRSEAGPPFFAFETEYDAAFFCAIGEQGALKLALGGIEIGGVTTYVPIGDTPTEDFEPFMMQPFDVLEAAHFVNRFEEIQQIEMRMSLGMWALCVVDQRVVIPRMDTSTPAKTKPNPWRPSRWDMKAEVGSDISFPTVNRCFRRMFRQTFFAVGTRIDMNALRVETNPSTGDIRMVGTDGSSLMIASRYAIYPKKLDVITEHSVHLEESVVAAMVSLVREKTPRRMQVIRSGDNTLVQIDDCQIHGKAHDGAFINYHSLVRRCSKAAMGSLFSIDPALLNVADFESFLRTLHNGSELAIEVTKDRVYFATVWPAIGVPYDLSLAASFAITWNGKPRPRKIVLRVEVLRNAWLALGTDAQIGFAGTMEDPLCLYAKNERAIGLLMPLKSTNTEVFRRIDAMKLHAEDACGSSRPTPPNG